MVLNHPNTESSVKDGQKYVLQISKESIFFHLRESMVTEEFDDLCGSVAGSSSSSELEDSSGSLPMATEGRTDANETDVEKERVMRMAIKETKDVWTLKFFVVLLIISTAGFVSAAAFKFIDQSQQKAFDENYAEFADFVQETVKVQAQILFASLQSYSDWITSEAFETNSSFPYVPLPTFEVEGHDIRLRSKVEKIIYSPLVKQSQKEDWVTFAAANHLSLLQNSNRFARLYGGPEILDLNQNISAAIVSFEDPLGTPQEEEREVMAPYWQSSPPPLNTSAINVDLIGATAMHNLYLAVNATKQALFGPILNERSIFSYTTNARVVNNVSIFEGIFSADEGFELPRAILLQPVFETLYDHQSKVVGLLHAVVGLGAYFKGLKCEQGSSVFLGVRSSCGDFFSFELRNRSLLYLGTGDLHDERYTSKLVVVPFYNFTTPETPFVPGHCFYSFHVYPTEEFETEYQSNLPSLITASIACVFLLMASAFVVYDWVVIRRNNKIVDAAARSSAIVASIFPSNFRDRILGEKVEQYNRERKPSGTKSRLKSFMSEGVEVSQDPESLLANKPIADLFTNTTVLFADIVGFTAWSSTREPSQVFTLLEVLYAKFDDIAKRRRIFKVETVGDCYVAVAGLPDPRKDHAVVMARFSKDLVHSMNSLVHKLEVALGPETGDLAIRVGLHSGPVVAGVLRGQRSRFQLFGDTMNTASRMESTGQANKIQISPETAQELIDAGKQNWVTEREDEVIIKGKGRMKTFWLAFGSSDRLTSTSSGSEKEDETNALLQEDDAILEESDFQVARRGDRQSRLIRWNVDVLLGLLKEVEARRDVKNSLRITSSEQTKTTAQCTVLEEVKEIITLPDFNAKTSKKANQTVLNPTVGDQLLKYVTSIASMYRDNPFHNFEHASHVTMSVVKLLSRIVAPDLEDEGHLVASKLHDHTYGITNDPLTQFACVFSALIHDVDHSGVPNSILVQENPGMATVYKGRSVAEQNSVDLAWSLLMDDAFPHLRQAIYRSDDEKQRFRQLVVNSVMATDIMDKDLKILRNDRWNKAFASVHEESSKDAIDRKATIVIEHLIQASDVAHTMQHWQIYRKWNERLFLEMHLAFKHGRSTIDPAQTWYDGELGFFDYYIIPLAKKLKDCGVFGVSSDEYLAYAVMNREEWAVRGQEIVAEMVDSVEIGLAKGDAFYFM